MKRCAMFKVCDKPITECRRVVRYNEITLPCFRLEPEPIRDSKIKVSGFYKDTAKRTYIEPHELKSIL